MVIITHAELYCTVLYFIVLYCTVLYRTILYCTVPVVGLCWVRSAVELIADAVGAVQVVFVRNSAPVIITQYSLLVWKHLPMVWIYSPLVWIDPHMVWVPLGVVNVHLLIQADTAAAAGRLPPRGRGRGRRFPTLRGWGRTNPTQGGRGTSQRCGGCGGVPAHRGVGGGVAGPVLVGTTLSPIKIGFLSIVLKQIRLRG